MIDERVFPHADACALAVADALAENIQRALEARGRAALALPGGRTPRHVLPLLSQTREDWSGVHLTLTDERWVDTASPESNERLVGELLLARAPGVRFTGLKTPGASPAAGREILEARLAAVPFPLDVTFLGMGEDGHIASLFPGGAALWAQADGRCLAVDETPRRGARMSLAPAALLGSRHIVLVLLGAPKIRVYRSAREPGRANELPVRLVLNQEQAPVTVFMAA